MTEPAPEQQVVPADPRFRRKIIACVVAASAVGSAAYAALYFILSPTNLPPNALGMPSPDFLDLKDYSLLMLTAFAMGLGLIAGGLYTLGLARTIYVTQRYPPEGVPTIRNTKIYTGAPARLRAVVTGVLSIIVVLGGIIIPLFTLIMLRNY